VPRPDKDPMTRARVRVAKQRAGPKYVASRIIDGTVDPLEGAKRIAVIAVAGREQDSHDLDPFVFADSEAGDRSNDRAFFENAVRMEARRLLAR
jgi:hypothetical protein